MAKKTLTTNQGIPVADNQNSLTAGQRGPVLLQDVHLIEKLAHFDRERIPERRSSRKRCRSSRVFPGTTKVWQPSRKHSPSRTLKRKTPVVQQTAVLGSPCSITLTIAAAEATVSQVGKGIFKTSQ